MMNRALVREENEQRGTAGTRREGSYFSLERSGLGRLSQHFSASQPCTHTCVCDGVILVRMKIKHAPLRPDPAHISSPGVLLGPQ